MGHRETTASSATPAPPRSFEAQLDLDRKAIERDLNEYVRSDKFKLMKLKDREDYIRAEMRRKLAYREKRSNTTTARKEFPRRFDEEREMQHFKSFWWTHIYAKVKGNDAEDDAEELPTERPRVKQEPRYDDESDTEDSGSDSSEIDRDSEDLEEDNEDESDDEPACVVVSRGFVIQNSNKRVGSFGFGTKARVEIKPKVSSLTGRVEPRGIVKEQPWKDVKPAWKWVDGKMVVYPPL